MNKNKLGVIISGIIWATIIIAIFTSCSTEKRCMRSVKFAQEHGCLTFTDSVNIKDSIRITLKEKEVDNATDSIMEQLRLALEDCANSHDSSPNDTTAQKQKQQKIRERIKEIIKQIPCEIAPTLYVNKGDSLKIWAKGGKLLYWLKIKPKPENVCEGIKWYQRYWWMWIVITMAFCIIMIQISNKISYTR